MKNPEQFHGIPDCADATQANDWTHEQLEIIRGIDFSTCRQDSLTAITGQDILDETRCAMPDSPAGRRFILATFLADAACYARQEDREEYPHLRHVLSTFPPGFRLWMQRIDDKHAVPVGYSGWHPIAETTFFLLNDTPGRITNRQQIQPVATLNQDRGFIYIFNVSIIANLHKTPASRLLIKSLAADIQRQNLSGMAAITVSPDGQRVVSRFGLHRSGSITHEGQTKDAFTCTLPRH